MTAPMEFEEQEGRELEAALSGFSSHPPLVCFPMRADWEEALRPREEMTAHVAWLRGQEWEEKPQHPEPEYVGAWLVEAHHLQIDTLGTAPASVLKLAELARESGWDVKMRYTRGHGIHATQGKPTSLRHSIAVAMGRHPLTERQAVAVYEKPVKGGTWSWVSIWVMGPDLPACGVLLLADLEEFLEDPQKPDSWFAGIKEYAQEKAAAAKERAKARPKRAKTSEGL